ncbi:MAG: hypothetical protein EBR89_11470, partial [Betaproteobacteria bacterium]|nr:hypothetical protein [Betaproteobacteria bacterium]
MNDTSSPTTPAAPLKWWDTLKVYGQPASLRMLALGFAAGLPLLLVLGTLSFRLREAGIDRSTIGHLSWVGLAYGFKWVWAPLVDRLPLPVLTPWLGRRRSWLLVSQLAIMAGLAGMAWQDPRTGLTPLVVCALLVAFASATQDIALDAFRIESADARLQAALAASYQTGYRLAMIWAGAGVLWIAAHQEAIGQSGYQQLAWQAAYLVMAASMGVGLVTVAFSREPAPVALAPARNLAEWLQSAVVAPFTDFWIRHRWHAVLVLALIAVYRISDVVMGIMANPFYVDMGYTKEEVAAVTKVYGVVMTLLGAFIGGVHRMAAALDGKIELVAGAFSSDPEKSKLSGQDLFLKPDRVYASYLEMAKAEAKLPLDERIDFVSIVARNDLHYPVAKAFLEVGIHVICEKPL